MFQCQAANYLAISMNRGPSPGEVDGGGGRTAGPRWWRVSR